MEQTLELSEIRIHIHSFIDIITNSSTEIYVQASEHTIKNIKSLVDSILSIGGSPLKCDDIFIMKLVSDREEDEDEDEDEDNGYDDEDYSDVSVSVNPIIEGDNARLASKILSDLTGLFNIDANNNY